VDGLGLGKEWVLLGEREDGAVGDGLELVSAVETLGETVH